MNFLPSHYSKFKCQFCCLVVLSPEIGPPAHTDKKSGGVTNSSGWFGENTSCLSLQSNLDAVTNNYSLLRLTYTYDIKVKLRVNVTL